MQAQVQLSLMCSFSCFWLFFAFRWHAGYDKGLSCQQQEKLLEFFSAWVWANTNLLISLCPCLVLFFKNISAVFDESVFIAFIVFIYISDFCDNCVSYFPPNTTKPWEMVPISCPQDTYADKVAWPSRQAGRDCVI